VRRLSALAAHLRELTRTLHAHSWEIGTHLSALLELSYPSLSPFADSTSWARPSPSSSPAPTEILSNVAQILSNQPQGQQQLVSDGSAADPASVGPFVVLANLTLDGDEQIGGRSKAQVDEAVQRQVDVLMEGTPRTPDGAISHRTEDVELWSDFMCASRSRSRSSRSSTTLTLAPADMVPPVRRAHLASTRARQS